MSGLIGFLFFMPSNDESILLFYCWRDPAFEPLSDFSELFDLWGGMDFEDLDSASSSE